MNPTALPAAALKHAADRVGEVMVGVDDHQFDACEAALFQRAEEMAPEAPVLAVTDLETEQLRASIGIHAHGYKHGPAADLHRQDLDIKVVFDAINHDLLMRAVKTHTAKRWVVLYLQR